MTPYFLVAHFRATGVLELAPNGVIFQLRADEGEDWALDLRRYWRPRRYLGQRITVIGPCSGIQLIEVLRLYIHEDAERGYWVV